MNRTGFVFGAFVFAGWGVACGPGTEVPELDDTEGSSTTVSLEDSGSDDAPEDPCGDGVLDSTETCDACPADCPSEGAVWERTFDGPGHGFDVAHSLAVGVDGSIYVGGVQELGDGTSTLWLTELDEHGEPGWTHTMLELPDYAGLGVRVAACRSGGVFALMPTAHSGVGYAVIERYDAAGERLWTRSAPEGASMTTMVGRARGGLVVAGVDPAPAPDTAAVFVALDDRGEPLWRVDRPGALLPAAIALHDDDAFSVAGFETDDDGAQRVWIGRFDADGNALAETSYMGSGGFTIAESITATADGSLVVGGSDRRSDGTLGGWLAEFDREGELRWTTAVHPGFGGAVREALATPDALVSVGYIVDGSSTLSIDRWRSQGEHDQQITIGMPRSLEPYAAALLPSGDLVVAGRVAQGGAPDAYVARFSL